MKSKNLDIDFLLGDDFDEPLQYEELEESMDVSEFIVFNSDEAVENVHYGSEIMDEITSTADVSITTTKSQLEETSPRKKRNGGVQTRKNQKRSCTKWRPKSVTIPKRVTRSYTKSSEESKAEKRKSARSKLSLETKYTPTPVTADTLLPDQGVFRCQFDDKSNPTALQNSYVVKSQDHMKTCMDVPIAKACETEYQRMNIFPPVIIVRMISPPPLSVDLEVSESSKNTNGSGKTDFSPSTPGPITVSDEALRIKLSKNGPSEPISPICKPIATQMVDRSTSPMRPLSNNKYKLEINGGQKIKLYEDGRRIKKNRGRRSKNNPFAAYTFQPCYQAYRGNYRNHYAQFSPAPKFFRSNTHVSEKINKPIQDIFMAIFRLYFVLT